MSKFFRYFVKRYPDFKDNVLKGNYKEALSIYADAYLALGEGKRALDDYWRVYTAAYDGLHRHNSTRKNDLREWIGDEKAFKGFMEYFSTRFGKNGICRVSNKAAPKAKKDNKMDTFLRKKQLINYIRLNIKKGVLDKKELFEKAKWYIKTWITLPRMALFVKRMKEMFSKRIAHLKAVYMTFDDELNQKVRKELDLLSHDQWAYENIDNVAWHSMEDYLLWHAAKYINHKGTGKNIPTNALTANLKANPLLTVLLTTDKENKIFLKSFRYQKRATYAESVNYKILSPSMYPIKEKDFLDRIKTSRNISGPKTLEESKEYIKLRGIYHKKILDFIRRAMPVLDLIDKRIGDAILHIIKNEDAQRIERILPEQRKYLESLPDTDASTKEQCVKVLNRIVGILSFITRVKLMSRRDYYDYYEYNMVRDPNKKEKKWVKPLDETLDVFIPYKEYPHSEYEYVQTEEGYTLARYDCSGILCMGVEKGNWVRKNKTED